MRIRLLAVLAAAGSLALLSGGIASASTAPGTRLATLRESGTTVDYGNAVSISGTTAVVGEVNTSSSGLGPGKAYVFARTSTGWKHTATLTASDQVNGTENSFGASVAVSGSMIVVGAPSDTSPCASCYASATVIGRIYVFRKTATGWKQAAEIRDPVSAPGVDGFGGAVATNGTIAYAGAPGGNSDPVGAVYAYSRTSSGTWTNIGVLQGTVGGFGYSLSAAGSRLAAGTSGITYNSESAAYVFTRTTSGWTRTTLQGRYEAAGDFFGASVSLSGGKTPEVAVGAMATDVFHGVAYVFTKTASGWKQVVINRPASSSVDWFGRTVAVSGKSLMVSDGAANNEIFFYARTTSGWKHVKTVSLHPLGTDTGGWTPLAAAGPLAVAGDLDGHAYVYES